MWYVIQTSTGKEQELVELIYKLFPVNSFKDCFFLKRKLLKRLGGKWLEVTETLFPAYVFLNIKDIGEIFYHLKKIPEFTKPLGDNDGAFIPLEKEEETFLKLLCRDKLECQHSKKREYIVKNTKIYLDDNGGIRKMEGPLEDFQDKLIQLNLRKRYAVIEIDIYGKKHSVLLGIKLEKDG